ncbi:Uncharacterized protein Fot_04464 [Forsythia ovata]|uniref:Uncharacterized protein n=1 Tax=Forsythia ovata TaxID=205694 RepID=A0ABD1XCM5_9LAMI
MKKVGKKSSGILCEFVGGGGGGQLDCVDLDLYRYGPTRLVAEGYGNGDNERGMDFGCLFGSRCIGGSANSSKVVVAGNLKFYIWRRRFEIQIGGGGGVATTVSKWWNSNVGLKWSVAVLGGR